MLSSTNNMPSAVPVLQNQINLVANTNTSTSNDFLNISKLKQIVKIRRKKDTLHDNDNTLMKIQYHLVEEYLNSTKSTIFSEIESSLSEVGDGIHNIQTLATNMRNVINGKRNIYKIDVEILKNHPQLKTILNQSGDHWLTTFGTENLQNLSLQNGLLSPKKELPKTPEGLEIVTTIKSDEKFNLPPSGTLVRKEFEVGSKAWIQKTNLLGTWEKGTILRICENSTEKLYRVRFDSNKLINPKFCNGKQLAYSEPSDVLIPVGTRIIAKYTDQVVSAMYAGVIAEPPKTSNNGRYLIFFDDGYAQYISQHDINVVREQSEDVSEDVHEKLRDFIKGYLSKYPERPMVKLQVNQFTKTELNSEWCDTKVVEVDASMVKLVFLKSQSTEWVYRGSTRLQPLYNELTNAASHRMTGKLRRQRGLPRKPNQPYVEYTTEIVTISDSDSEDETENEKPKTKNTARKSTGGNLTKYLNERVSSDLLVPGRVRDTESHFGSRIISRFKNAQRKEYDNHICSPACGEFVDQEDFFNNSPLSIPVRCGWERQIWKFNDERPANSVVYRSKCGRQLRNMDEVYQHLLTTNASVTIDLFSADVNLLVFRSFVPHKPLYCNEDIAEGQEKTRISCINSLNDQPPPYVEYASERFPGEGVHLNLDENFLCCCSCTDNCQNALKCECQRITNYARYGQYTDEAPYKNRRLKDNIITGIYECNKLCPCNQHCTNKVAQNGIKVRLQMFKTQFKGWGIRCLDDIDAGMFICVYAGQLLTEQGADEDGNQFGDEYLAELDHIEVVERIKEGYESDVVDMDVDYDPVKDFKQDYSDEEPVKKKRRGRKGKSTGGASKNSKKSNQSTKVVKQIKKPLTESSDSELNMCNGSDSDFDSPLRTTASSTYATRSTRRSAKRKNDNLPPVNGNADSSSSVDVEKIDDSKELPDIKTSFDSISLYAAPLSPKSAEIVEKAEIKRKPKFSEVKNHVVKKSSSAKNSSQSAQTKKPVKNMPIRDYYKEDGVYIMDAKSKGNIGRYLNHSCNPNVFVQNVFVDTHDLRFPWVSFFAQNFILAGTELTWDYNYEVGSVTNKVMYCYCDSSNCRGRLL
ncbi:histone-lysine N-methyltransferase SETDB1-like [Uloborus diversus]|uniref:histone-lysine N-methyltransferase SETDB1-like n=1 Tax=Uloborus diversus TaxID=327109 RepID=UPI002409C662|nr:histone-lysine N-methyltransferase SETDB1-like [Uloborus diversus]